MNQSNGHKLITSTILTTIMSWKNACSKAEHLWAYGTHLPNTWIRSNSVPHRKAESYASNLMVTNKFLACYSGNTVTTFGPRHWQSSSIFISQKPCFWAELVALMQCRHGVSIDSRMTRQCHRIHWLLKLDRACYTRKVMSSISKHLSKCNCLITELVQLI